MRRPNGSWRKPPPPWPPIRSSGAGAHNLDALIDVNREPQRWHSLDEWLALWT